MVQTDSERTALLMPALGNQYGGLQAARGATIAECSSRTGVAIAVAFLRHQWLTWMRVVKAPPML